MAGVGGLVVAVSGGCGSGGGGGSGGCVAVWWLDGKVVVVVVAAAAAADPHYNCDTYKTMNSYSSLGSSMLKPFFSDMSRLGDFGLK